MLNSLLTSSYLQYKSDTDTVASWLVSTARKCGYATDLLMKGKQTQQGSGRLKGETRKLARNAPTKPIPSTPPVQTYTIAIKDFIGLAEYIAGYKGIRVEVPEGFASSLHRAIAVRRSYGANVSEALGKTAESLASDDRHLYFIGVLEHMWDTLRPLMPESLKNMEPETKLADTEKLPNLFSKLELFEPSTIVVWTDSCLDMKDRAFDSILELEFLGWYTSWPETVDLDSVREFMYGHEVPYIFGDYLGERILHTGF